jgi:chitinase
MIGLFFEDENSNKGQLPDPYPNSPPNNKVSFCEYVNALWDVDTFVWPRKDTQGGVGKSWKPILHVVARFPGKRFHRDEFVTLEDSINTPSKTNPWNLQNPWSESAWKKNLDTYTKARSIFFSLRQTMGSRIYQSDSKIRGIMKAQTDRIGDVLDALDTDLLPKNTKSGFEAWTKQDLRNDWHRFMNRRYTTVTTNTNTFVTRNLEALKREYVTQAEKARWTDAKGDSQAVLDEKKKRRDFIAAIEKFEVEWNALPAWFNPL